MTLYLDHNPTRGEHRNQIWGTPLKIISVVKLPSGLYKVEVED